MALSVSKKNYGAAGTGVSLQGMILEHFLESMADVRESLSGKDEKDTSKRMDNFRLHILYLRKLCPDRKVQEEIKKAIDKAKQDYERDKTFNGKDLVEYASQMETITEIMIYLNQGMDLIHHDITGALTKRASAAAREPDHPQAPEGSKEGNTT